MVVKNVESESWDEMVVDLERLALVVRIPPPSREFSLFYVEWRVYAASAVEFFLPGADCHWVDGWGGVGWG